MHKVIPLSQRTIRQIETLAAQVGGLRGGKPENRKREKPLQTSRARDGMLKCKAHPSPGHKDMHA